MADSADTFHFLRFLKREMLPRILYYNKPDTAMLANFSGLNIISPNGPAQASLLTCIAGKGRMAFLSQLWIALSLLKSKRLLKSSNQWLLVINNKGNQTSQRCITNPIAAEGQDLHLANSATFKVAQAEELRPHTGSDLVVIQDFQPESKLLAISKW